MANSPGPSSSKSQPHTEKKSETGEKKKKTRRKPRNKNKKEVNNAIVESEEQEAAPLNYNFQIGAVQQQGVVYKQRDKSRGPINVKSFITNGTIPCVFLSKGCATASTLNILKKIRYLSINGVCQSSPVKQNEDKKSTKKKKKKDLLFFPKFITEDEVKVGLQDGTLMKGFIRVNPKNSKESYVGNEDVSKSDYVIGSVLDRNRALDGDEVVLRQKTVVEGKKQMEVVYITQRIHPRTAVGFLEPIEKNKEYALFTPRDKRIPKMKIPKISWPSGFQSNPKLYSEILFLAKISDWKEPRFALGTIIENLGLNGDLKVESYAILKEFCLDATPFGDEVKRFLPKSTEIPLKEFDCREDFRKECVFTIDPLTARDLDDAVSCKQLKNGNFEVGVHISDASHFLTESTKLDEIVRSKATTIYMVDNVYHMLPVELCLHCSLLPGQDKLAFSIIWELTSSGEIVNQRITRTVINSCVQLAYEHAQAMIDDPTRQFTNDDLPVIHNGFNGQDLSRIVNDLNKIAVNLREKRKQNGSLKIDQVKISFSLDPQTGEPQQFWIYENKPAHRLIEEFMLLANMSVAKFIEEKFPDLAFLRLHEPPKPTMMVDLQKNLETIGIHIDISSSGGIQSSLNKYNTGTDFLSAARAMVLNHLLAKPMQRARYFCAGAVEETLSHSHYALSIPIYTHFTSPIRRYADIMVHRLLAAALNYADRPKWSPEEVAMVAETCNRQKYHAKRAGEASCDLYLAHFVEKNQPYVQKGMVVDTKERSIDVLVLNTGSVVRIYTNNFGDNVTYKPQEIEIPHADPETSKKMWRIFVKFPKTPTSPAVNMVLEIFTLVTIQLTRKPKSYKLEGKLLRPEPEVNLITL